MDLKVPSHVLLLVSTLALLGHELPGFLRLQVHLPRKILAGTSAHTMALLTPGTTQAS